MLNCSIGVAQLLLERGCSVNAVGGVLASTPLHWAARHGHSHMVALLFLNGADPNLKDVEGKFNINLFLCLFPPNFDDLCFSLIFIFDRT